MQAGVAPVAAREAYMVAFHAAQAALLDRRGDVPRTHSGVHGEFGRLAKEEPRLGRDLSRFLSKAYELKDIADYGVGSTIEASMAQAAIHDAERFLAAVELLLSGGRAPAG